MGLSKETRNKIFDLLVGTVENKIAGYNPETKYQPFHDRLLGKQKYAIFSLVHSMNTTFGMSIWEQVAVIIARENGFEAETKYKLLGEINKEAGDQINTIYNDLRTGTREPSKKYEIEEIREVIEKGEENKHPDSTVDVYIKKGNQENYIDITTVKPNKKEFAVLKRKLLEWVALRLSQNPDADVCPRLALPYNPYHPEPYTRWTTDNIYEDDIEILVGRDFWNFVAEDDIYDELLKIFEEAGQEVDELLQEKFDNI